MPAIQAQVSSPSAIFGAPAPAGLDTVPGGQFGEAIVSEAYDKYYNLAKAGVIFTSTTTPLGLAIPIYTSVTPLGNVLWNPIGSGVKCVLLEYVWNYVGGASVNFAIMMMARNGVGAQIGTASPITAFAATNPVNSQLGLVNTVAGTGSGNTSKVNSSNAGTCTFTAGVATEAVQTVGFVNQLLSGSAQGAVAGINVYDFKNRIHVYPGTVIWFAANLASVALVAQSLTWAELPI